MKLRSGTIVSRTMSNPLSTNPVIGTVIEYVEDAYDSESEMTEARDEEVVADAGRESVESQPPSIMLLLREMMKKMDENSKKVEENSRIMAEQNKQQFAQTQEKIEEIQISINHQFEAQDEKWDSRVSDIMESFNVVKTEGHPTEGLAEENVENLESYVEREEQEMEILTEESEGVKGKEHEKMIPINGEMGDGVKKISENPLVTVERKLDKREINVTGEWNNDLLERIQDGRVEQIEIRLGENLRKVPERNNTLYAVDEEKDVNYEEMKQSFINISMNCNRQVEILRKSHVPNFDKMRMCRDQHLQEVYNEIKQLHCPLTTPLFLLLYAS